MGFHHLAIATKDTKANHEFYTGPMGFELAHVEIAGSGESGWAKHLFYDTGNGEMIAFWEIHDPDLGDDWSPAIATGLGLPIWSNHIAFAASDLDDLARRRTRWLEHGVDVMEIDHDWCVSVYAEDPNGILVEFCTLTRDFTDEDRAEAQRLLAEAAPRVQADKRPDVKIFKAADYRG